jgi:hypothetical protein
MYMYNIEVFTRQGLDTNAAKEYVYRKADMVPAVYDKGTHYVTNQRLTIEILKEISDCEEVLQVSGEYTGCSAPIGPSHELRNQGNSSKYSFYG